MSGGTLTWTGGAIGTWSDAAAWSIDGAPAGVTPTTLDVAQFSTPAIVGGVGVAGELTIAAALVTLTGNLNAPGLSGTGVEVDDGGTLALLGSADSAMATIDSAGVTLASNGEAALGLARWVADAPIVIGNGAFGLLALSSVSAPSVTVGAGGDGLLSVGPSSTLTVAGALTIGSSGTATLIDDGTLTAGSIIFGASGVGVAKGTLTAGSFTIATGGLLAGAVTLAGPGGGAAPITLDGTIEGAVAIYPDVLVGPVTGSGTLLVDAGGAIAVQTTVAASIAARFAAGVSPFYIDAGGNAGGILTIDDPADFAGTIDGFAPGNQIELPTGVGLTGASLQAGNRLALLAGTATIAVLQLDPTTDFSPYDFTVAPAGAPAGTATDIPAPPATAIGLAPAGNPLAPLITQPATLRSVAGATGVIPPISVLDAAAIAAGGTVTVTLTAGAGTFNELISLPDEFAFTTEISQTGTGTGTLSITSADLSLLDWQLSLVEYVAGGTPGSDTIAIDVSAIASASTHTTTGSVAVTVAPSAEAFTWTGAVSNSFSDAANWTGGAAGPPGAGDTANFGGGSYAVTGDGSAGQVNVSGRVLFQGAIDATGGDGAALVVDGGGIAGFAGFAFVLGNAEIGVGTPGELDLYGALQEIQGDLLVGLSAPGFVQVDGAAGAGGTVEIGIAAAGTMQVGGGGLGLGSGFPPQFNAADVLVGISTGVSGLVLLGDGGEVEANDTFEVGVAGTGSLLASGQTIDGVGGSIAPVEIQNDTGIIGVQSGSSGRVELSGQAQWDNRGNLTVGAAGAATLVAQGSAVVTVGAFSGQELDIAAQPGSTGLVIDRGTASIGIEGNLAVGGTMAGAGGSGTVDGNVFTFSGSIAVWGHGVALLDHGWLSGTVSIAAGGLVTGPGTLGADNSTVVNDGTVIATAGTLEFSEIAGGGTLEITAGGAVDTPTSNFYYNSRATIDPGQTIDFAGPGKLVTTSLVQGSTVSNPPILGFSNGDTLELVTIGNSLDGSSLVFANGTLAIGTAASIAFAGLGADPHFSLVTHTVSDAGAGEAFQNDLTVACFASGTRLLAAAGEMPVERLCVGDPVLTVGGEFRKIRWIGHRTIDCRRHPRPASVWPVRVSADAFGLGRPHQDLFLSPDHAVLIEAVLIPIRHLINRTTIAQVPVDEVTYYHVELPRHEIVLAEGLPAESYLDTGNRSAFANGGGAVDLHPDFAPLRWDADACAPLVITGPLLESATRLLFRLQRTECFAHHFLIGAAGG